MCNENGRGESPVHRDRGRAVRRERIGSGRFGARPTSAAGGADLHQVDAQGGGDGLGGVERPGPLPAHEAAERTGIDLGLDGEGVIGAAALGDQLAELVGESVAAAGAPRRALAG